MDHPLLRKLRYFVDFEECEARALRSLPALEREIRFSPAQSLVTVDQDTRGGTMLLNRGWALRYRLLSDGRRQILNFVLPGDFLDPTGFVTHKADYSIVAITEVSVSAVHSDALFRLFDRSTRIAAALWWNSAHEAAMARAHLVAVGRQNAYERIAYLLWELWARLRVIEAADKHSFHFPGTQLMISDALGLSSVHTSRTLARLKAEGLISIQGQRIDIRDADGLKAIAEVSRSGLHLNGAPPGMRRILGIDIEPRAIP
ncbi:MAG TPA: Crp/Fnr family transcriptional regulator [Gammaproteobacteria bacterium]|nr:Crp/Fnr family transcriptional regulator [Gammaproteobacteria bacterium]